MSEITPLLEVVPIEPLPPLTERERIRAAANTAISLMQLGDESIRMTEEDENIARDAFIDGRPLTKYEMQMPGVVMKLNALLDEYDYSIVEDANRIRNYVVNRLIEQSTDPKTAMKALELLGKLSSVDLFTERKEVVVTHRSTEDLERELNESLTILLNPEHIIDVTEVEKSGPSVPENLDLDDVFQ